MLTFYEFQQRYPDDEACLEQIMVSRYGGLEFDCRVCGEFSSVVLHSVWNLSADWHEQLFPGYLLPWRSR